MANITVTMCIEPENGMCPYGCPTCVCASPDTSIATPDGERPISDLLVGDLVYSVHQNKVMPRAVLEVRVNPVFNHSVVRVTLTTGSTLEISARHPTADGRTFGDLSTGDALDSVEIVSVEVIPYQYPFTYDILPDSDTGIYFAGGVAIGSTLFV